MANGASRGPLDALAGRELRHIDELRVDFAHLGEVADCLDDWATVVEKAAGNAREANKPLFVGAGQAFALGDPAMVEAGRLRDRLARRPAVAERNLNVLAARLRTLADLVEKAKKDYNEQGEREHALVELLRTSPSTPVT